MVPLQQLLRAHGIEACFPIPTLLHITKKDCLIVIGLEEGEHRYQDLDQIFCVCNPGDKGIDYHVRANQMKGVIRTLKRWQIIDDEEITDDEIELTAEKGYISCDGCQERQSFNAHNRFKQCKLCNENEKAQDFPHFKGFYCSKDCQNTHWGVHKQQFHRD